jgi:hypothetical protein
MYILAIAYKMDCEASVFKHIVYPSLYGYHDNKLSLIKDMNHRTKMELVKQELLNTIIRPH